MAFTEMDYMSGGGGTLINYSGDYGPITTSYSTFTVPNITKISAIAAYYNSSIVDYAIVDDNGDIVIQYSAAGAGQGVGSVSGNTFTFKWSSGYTSFLFYVVGI